MKAILILFACGIFATAVYAQGPSISWYSIEGKDYYEVSGCTPGSSAAFYSSKGGGHFLGNKTIGSNGKVTAVGDKTFRPAMFLNNGVGGNNYVGYTPSREFAVGNIQVSGSGKAAAISWRGAVASTDDISFHILKSTDGRNFQLINTVSSRPGEEIAPYVFMDEWSGAAALYKVAVVSKTKGLRYVSQPVLLAGTSTITVFPTVVTSDLYIALPTTPAGPTTYSIVNSEGKRVEGGILTMARTVVSTNKLAAGNYLVSVNNGVELRVVKIRKL